MIGLSEGKNVVKQAAKNVDASELLKAAARSALDKDGSLAGEARSAAAAANGHTGRGVAKTGLIAAGGVAGVTAASAAVSALRRSGRSA